VFVFVGSLLAGPCVILFRVTCVFAGLQVGPCVPPVLFDLASTLPIKVSIMNLIHTGSGSNAFWDALTKLTSSISVEGVQYAVQPYYSIRILPFRRFISSDAFLKVIYPFIFVVPVIPSPAISVSCPVLGIGYRARLLIQIRIEYSRGEASGLNKGAEQPMLVYGSPTPCIRAFFATRSWLGIRHSLPECLGVARDRSQSPVIRAIRAK
jgi:hypothetical protein